MENKAFKLAGIKNLMTRNYKVPTDLIDLEALVDNNLCMAENWFNIKPMVILLSPNQFMDYMNTDYKPLLIEEL